VRALKKKILYSRKAVDRRVKELADTISHDFEGKEIVLVGVLKGAFIFLADLTRSLNIAHIVDFTRLASYGSGTVSSGKIAVAKDIETDIEGKDVLIVEDIIDTGITMAFLRERLEKKNPASIRICTLIDKKHRREVDITADYVGFTMGEGFVVGYGLDFDEAFRCLPDIYVIEEHSRDYTV